MSTNHVLDRLESYFELFPLIVDYFYSPYAAALKLANCGLRAYNFEERPMPEVLTQNDATYIAADTPEKLKGLGYNVSTEERDEDADLCTANNMCTPLLVGLIVGTLGALIAWFLGSGLGFILLSYTLSGAIGLLSIAIYSVWASDM